MTHEYQVTGMTCSGCKAKVETLLKGVDHVKDVRINLEKASAEIDMDKHVPTSELAAALAGYPKYRVTEAEVPQYSIIHQKPETLSEPEQDPGAGDIQRSTWETYKPVFLIAIYLLLVTLLVQGVKGAFDLDSWMNHFMGGFFLVFSFFKMFDVAGFADSYSMYDIIAKRWRGWGFVYPFVELALGLMFLSNAWPLITNSITFVVMTLSIIGVLQSVLNKRKIQCACLGAVFNLPMSTVTIIEDALMILMSGVMIARFVHS